MTATTGEIMNLENLGQALNRDFLEAEIRPFSIFACASLINC